MSMRGFVAMGTPANWRGPTIASLVCEAEPRATRFGVVNSFTRAAQRLQPIERIVVERLAGRLLGVQT